MSNSILVSWVSWPFRDRPRASTLLSIFFVGMAVLLWNIAVVNWQMPFYYYFGMTILFMGLITYFIPSYYTFYDTHIEAKYLFFKVRREYTDFRCYFMDKRGIMLSTFRRPNRLDAFRGLNLRFSKDAEEKQELLELLEKRIGNKQ
ncbi:MAG: hypothetical protein P9L91_03545 [Candidatus Zophobacter franzmannii]|nr:hypothetical protein [Candidatus Zophobacter franzmannii]